MLFVLSWARVRRVRRGCISSELLISGGGVRSISVIASCSKIHSIQYIRMVVWRMGGVVSVVVTVWGSVGMFVCDSESLLNIPGYLSESIQC